MRVLILDESRKRLHQLQEILSSKRHEVYKCENTNDFMRLINEEKPDRLLLDMESWIRGRMIYSYFRFHRKLEGLPILFYNAPESFVALGGRRRHDLDRVLYKPADIEAIVEAVLETQ